MDTKKTVIVTSVLYSLTKQIFSLMIVLFHARVKTVLVKLSANVGKCRFHVSNIAVAKQKRNVQPHMIKNMTILIAANIWNNIMLFSPLTIYIDHLLIHSCLSTPVESGHRKSQSSEILFGVTPVTFCKALKRKLNKIQLNPMIFSFLTKRPSGKADPSGSHLFSEILSASNQLVREDIQIFAT